MLNQALTLPSTREESLALLDETTAALELDNLLAGVLDFGALRTPVVSRHSHLILNIPQCCSGSSNSCNRIICTEVFFAASLLRKLCKCQRAPAYTVSLSFSSTHRFFVSVVCR